MSLSVDFDASFLNLNNTESIPTHSTSVMIHLPCEALFACVEFVKQGGFGASSLNKSSDKSINE